MFAHRICTRTASAAIRSPRRLAAPAVGRHAQRMEIHTTAPTSIKGFPEVEPDKKMPHSPTTVAEREMIRKTEKNTHSDMDEMRPPKSEFVGSFIHVYVCLLVGWFHSRRMPFMLLFFLRSNIVCLAFMCVPQPNNSKPAREKNPLPRIPARKRRHRLTSKILAMNSFKSRQNMHCLDKIEQFQTIVILFYSATTILLMVWFVWYEPYQ